MGYYELSNEKLAKMSWLDLPDKDNFIQSEKFECMFDCKEYLGTNIQLILKEFHSSNDKSVDLSHEHIALEIKMKDSVMGMFFKNCICMGAFVITDNQP